MGLAPDLSVRVPVEDLEALGHPVLVARRRAVAHVVQDLRPDILVLVLSKVKQSVPEVRLVCLDSAWAHLLGGLQSDHLVLVSSELNDLINVLSVTDLGQSGGDVFLCGTLWLLLRVDLQPLVTFTHY